MISFRYHLVSLVAVFFALAVGILVGTTVLNQGVIEQLERRTEGAVARAESLRDELDQVVAERDLFRELAEALEPVVLDTRLEGEEVVLVTAEGVDLGEVDGVRTALARASATITGVLVLTNRMALDDQAERDDLAEVLGAQAGDDATALGGLAGEALGLRLADGGEGTEDILADLVSAGFMAVRAQADLTRVGGSGQIVVILTGAGDDSVVDPSPVFVPMVRTLVDEGISTAAGETTDAAHPFVPLLRNDGGLDGRLVTVDNADTMPGRIGLVLGVRVLLDTGQGGDYGVDGDELIPTP